MIKIENIKKSYGNSIIIDGLTMTIPERKVTSIVGPNGAGKSTFLGMLSRTVQRDSGSILLDDCDILQWDSRELSKKLCILKQSSSVSIRITVNDLVEFGRYPYCQGRLTETDRQMVAKALEYMDLLPFKDRTLDQLSGGQRQRAYIATLLAQDTDYIFLDEPLNNLDMKYATDLMKTLRRLVFDLGKTVLIVIHDINMASAYSDHLILMKDGILKAGGSVDEIMKDHILESVYDMQFKIRNFDGQLICSYG